MRCCDEILPHVRLGALLLPIRRAWKTVAKEGLKFIEKLQGTGLLPLA